MSTLPESKLFIKDNTHIDATQYPICVLLCVLLQPMPAVLMNFSVITTSASTLHGGVMVTKIALTVLMRTQLSAVSFCYLSLSGFCIFLVSVKTDSCTRSLGTSSPEIWSVWQL